MPRKGYSPLHKHRQRRSDHKTKNRTSRSRSRSRQYLPSSSSPSPSKSTIPALRISISHPLNHPNPDRNPKTQSFNPRMLVSIISHQKKLNRRLDTEQTNRAAQKFRQIFKEEIKPVTMSSFLSNQQLVKRIQVKHGGTQPIQLVCSECGDEFVDDRLLEQHLRGHR